jgi:hypothetical protein
VVAMGGSVSSRAGMRGPGRAEPAPEASMFSRVPVSIIALIAAIGVFVSCVGYADGRAGQGANSGPGIALYWLGQCLILIPAAGRLLSRRQMTNGDTIALIVILTVAEYLLKVSYIPTGFAFNDEFLHWRGTTNMLTLGKLFEPNYGLPVGTYYPGLEEVTSALISATGLPVFQAGLIVAGIAHLLFVLFLYLAFCVAIRSHRIAGIAILIYFSAPALTSFNSMFVYETLALAFLGFTMVAALRSAIEKSPQVRRSWFVVAVLSILATTITHHVTSYMLTAFLVLVAIASRLTGSRNTAMRFGLLALISAASVIGWIATVARSTISYFSPTVMGIVDGLEALTKNDSSGTTTPATNSNPILNAIISDLGVVVVTVLIALGVWQAWKRHRRHPWIIGMMIGSLGWFVIIGIRLGTPDGQELAGRAATFVYIPISVLAALALTRVVNSAPVRRWGALVTAVVLAAVTALLLDGLANGWPPFWERLPGPHLVASFEASVGPQEINASYWFANNLGSGTDPVTCPAPQPGTPPYTPPCYVDNRIAADAGIYPVLIGYGGQDPLQNISWLYQTATWTKQLANRADAEQVQFVETDNRLTKSLPPAGTYFPGETVFDTNKISPAALNKFNHIQGVSRIYDDGNIVFYDLVNWGYVPPPTAKP